VKGRWFSWLHPDGNLPLACLLGAALFCFLFIASWLGWLLLLATVAVALPFHDPQRITPSRAGLVVAPADGKVVSVVEAEPPEELGLAPVPRSRVSIHIELFDPHVNRVPVDGTVREIEYRPGAFGPAGEAAASEVNERQSTIIDTEAGGELLVVQIASRLTRKIVNELKPGQAVRAGERFGIIRFGSRVDVYLPEDVRPLVCEGQRMIGGETVIADLDADEPARRGEPR
jgi:phosphatidylserine decarboxylase